MDKQAPLPGAENNCPPLCAKLYIAFTNALARTSYKQVSDCQRMEIEARRHSDAVKESGKDILSRARPYE